MKKNALKFIIPAMILLLSSCVQKEDYNTYKCTATITNFTGSEQKINASCENSCYFSLAGFTGDTEGPFTVSSEKTSVLDLYYTPGKVDSDRTEFDINFSIDDKENYSFVTSYFKYREDSSTTLAIYSTKMPKEITDEDFEKLSEDAQTGVKKWYNHYTYSSIYDFSSSTWKTTYNTYEEYEAALKNLEAACEGEAILLESPRAFITCKEKPYHYYNYY